MRVHLIAWKQEEADVRAAALREQGITVEVSVPLGGGATAMFRQLRGAPPDAVVIDLDRLPSHGKAVGVAMGESKSLRAIPLVFAGGAAAKVGPIRALLPDALYTPWERVVQVLPKAAGAAPAPVIAKRHSLWASTPLLRKLTIKPGMTVLLVNAPAAFFKAIGSLPDSVTWAEDPGEAHDLEIRFVEDMDELTGRLRRAAPCPLWIAWPKQTARASELKQQTIRELGSAFGLVDYKICAMDATWSAMLFSRRKTRSKP